MSRSVSVILPTFNRAGALPRAMRSVLAQTHRDLELLVVDDGSTDGTAGIVAAIGDSRVRYLPHAVNRGPAAARNAGLKAARHDLIAFQDSDDEWLLDKLEGQIAALDAAGAGCAVVLGGILRLNGAQASRYPKGPWSEPRDVTPLEVVRQSLAFPQSWLVRRGALEQAGTFDESLRVVEDWDLLIRLSLGTRVRLLPRLLVVSRQRADGLSLGNPDWAGQIRRVLDKHAAALAADNALAGAAEYALARFLADAGRLPETRAALRRSLRHEPRSAHAWALLALACAGPALTRGVLRYRRETP